MSISSRLTLLCALFIWQPTLHCVLLQIQFKIQNLVTRSAVYRIDIELTTFPRGNRVENRKLLHKTCLKIGKMLFRFWLPSNVDCVRCFRFYYVWSRALFWLRRKYWVLFTETIGRWNDYCGASDARRRLQIISQSRFSAMVSFNTSDISTLSVKLLMHH